jgi:hypothetical protein
MYELDDSGKYSDLCDFDATTRLHRSASLHVARAKADGNTTDNGDGEWDATPPEFLPAVCGLLEPEEGADEEEAETEASYEGNHICHGLISISFFFRICPQQEAEAGLWQWLACQLCFFAGRRRFPVADRWLL